MSKRRTDLTAMAVGVPWASAHRRRTMSETPLLSPGVPTRLGRRRRRHARRLGRLHGRRNRSPPTRLRRPHRTASHVQRQRCVRSGQPVLQGARHERPHVLHVPPPRAGLDDHAGSVQRRVSSRSRGLDPIFRHERRLELRRRRRLHARQAPGRLQPAPQPRAHSHRHRRSRRRRVRHRQRGRPVRLRRAVDRGVDVPAAAAVHEPALPERRHVGRPRIVAGDDDPAGPRQAGRRCDAWARAGVAAPHDRRRRRQIVAFETGLFTAQARDDAAGSLRADGAHRRSGRAVAAAVLHRHQRSGRPESDRRAVRSERRSRSSTRGRMRTTESTPHRARAPSPAASRSSTRSRS